MRVAVIVLAAGNSKRFGANKLLHEVEGQKMYTRIFAEAEKFRRSTPSITVTVVTQYEEIVLAAQNCGYKIVRNIHPEDGISSSLKLGLAANKEADACLFVAADQPWLTAQTLKGLTDTWMKSGKRIACASAEGVPGNPCIFGTEYFDELRSLTGDVGGKKVVKAHMEDAAFFEVQDKRELADVDEPTALV